MSFLRVLWPFLLPMMSYSAESENGARFAISLKHSSSHKEIKLIKGGKTIRTFNEYEEMDLLDSEHLSPEEEFVLLDAVELLYEYTPNGVEVFELLKNKQIFTTFFLSSRDLGVTIHESLHYLDTEEGHHKSNISFKLLDGAFLSLPIQQTQARSIVFEKILSEEERKNHYAKEYLTGKAGKQGIETLLEELNAYSHGNMTTLQLAEGLEEATHFNQGLIVMMYYILSYLKIMANQNSQTSSYIKENKDFKTLLLTLWRQAERVLTKACESEFLVVSNEYLTKIYSEENVEFLTSFYQDEEAFYPLRECGF